MAPCVGGLAVDCATYEDYGYVHLGWAGLGWLSSDQGYFYQNDEEDEAQGLTPRTRMLVWDLSDLEDPILAKEHLGLTAAVDHNLYVHGDVIYHSNYDFGVRIIDIADPANPLERGFFDTVPEPRGFGSWSIYPWFESGLFVATSWREGIFVLRLQQ
ncbi:choice-of-anchor B family protein [Candidatus Palauibacter sp.]|uniref:choice-of-anchor B family protein n=1 Tax=Candidatus Palauibacter sp. TaxID=3101350 RepID=UPI003CC5421D